MKVLILISLLFFYSCTNNETQDLVEAKFCTELFSDSSATEGVEIKGVAPHASLWWHSIEFPLFITVKFLNGTDFQKSKVRQYAKEWEVNSNSDFDGKYKIRLRFIPYDGSTSGNRAQIRVVFRPGGSSSYIGSDALRIHPDSPTVYFGWINEGQSEAAIRQVVLHEFGHVLGLVHEHQSPTANIPWDKDKVYDYYARTQTPPWDRSKVDYNIFRRYEASATNYTAYDSNSIMHYAIPNSLTVGDYEVQWKTELSTIDKEFIKKIYKYQPCILNETCCFDRRGRRIPCP